MEEKEYNDAISSMSEHVQQTLASVNLSYDEPLSPAALQDLIDTFKRIESGETTYDQEDERMLKEWNEIQARR
jgi:hypothetical protein